MPSPKTVSLALPPLHAGQYQFVTDPHRFVIASCGTKALWVDEDIPTPSGWRKMIDIQPGDRVFSELGAPVVVEYASPVYLNSDCYAVTATDGARVVADGGHLWAVRSSQTAAWETLTTRQLAASSGLSWLLPDTPCAERQRSILRIEPALSVPVKCIRVDNPTSLFLAGKGYLPTHNTGKTFGMSVWLLQKAWNRYQSVSWWCAPTFKQARIAFNLIGTFLPQGRYRVSRSDLTYELIRADGNTHSRIEFRSADIPSSLRGEGVHHAVVDEAAYWARDSYVSVYTTVTRTRGHVRVISTPKGRNWFYEEWVKGWYPEEREKNPEYFSYQLPTSANPHVPREALAEFEKNMPADVFRQEICAEFLDESAGVFKNVRACQTATWAIEPEGKAQYVMGIDWAKMADYTVFTVARRDTKEVVYIERHNQIDWNSNIKKAVDLARKYNNAMVLMDATGVGDVPLDSMKAVYPHVDGYVIGNNQAKVALIQKLQFALENQQIRLPHPTAHANAGILEYELSMYGYQMSSTGKFLFSAPEGYNDDTVTSLAMANWQLQQEQLIYRARQLRGI